MNHDRALRRTIKAEEDGQITAPVLNVCPPDMCPRQRDALFMVGMGMSHSATAKALGYAQRETVSDLIIEHRAIVDEIATQRNLVIRSLAGTNAYQTMLMVSNALTSLLERARDGDLKLSVQDTLNLAKTGQTMVQVEHEIKAMEQSSTRGYRNPVLSAGKKALNTLKSISA